MTNLIGRAGAVALSLAILGSGSLNAQPSLNLKGMPDLQLPGNTRGQAAVDALGAHLPDVARAHGMTAEGLRRILMEDHRANVDPKGRVFYTDADLASLPQPGPTATPATDYAAGAAIPLDQTFLLHSKPGAARVLFLDFDGHTLSGTAWNANYNGGRDIIAPPWDIDGNPAVFGDSERLIIQGVWKRVSEDYAPFNVDVTTQDPGASAITRSSSSDTVYGMRVLVSPISSYFGNYGGIAYVGAFDDVGDSYKPALVFPENLANGEKYIAEACSHEAGHTLGLSHDGTTSGVTYYAGQGSGETGWAPIMGNGYYQNVTQWSKGEYAGANNTQDDLAIIASYVGYSPDDHGNTLATAKALPNTASVYATGVIETSADVDMFRFSTDAGTVTFNVTPAESGPDLDISLSLYNSSGGLIAVANPVDGLGASLNLGLNAGTYYLQVDGTGKGDPATTGYSSYASLGQYSVTGAIIPTSSPVNYPPVAAATATPSTGTAPLVVTLSGQNSIDSDGSIISYSWSFGDGSSGSGVTVQHTYQSAGTYVATLTVTDNAGTSSSSSVTIIVQAQQIQTAKTIIVSGIQLLVTRSSSGSSVRATVKITDISGTPIAGATVTGSWGGVISGSSTGTTDSSGSAYLNSRRAKRTGTATFTVTGVTAAGATYSPAQNIVTSANTTL